jgi:lipopolysaccharide export system permease protein
MLSRYTLNFYLFKIFCRYFALTSFTLLCLLFISNIFDILQNFKSSTISPEQFWHLIILKIPYIFNEISSLLGFFSTLLFLRYLIRHNELIIILSSGVPIWQVFIIPIVATFTFGIMFTALINPLGTYGLKEYNALEKSITNAPKGNVTISTSGIFVFEKYQNTNRIIQIKSIDSSNNLLNNVTLLIVDDNKNFLERIDAGQVYLSNKNLEFIKPIIFDVNDTKNLTKLNMPTNLSINSLVQHFVAPEFIYLWGMKDTIDKFAKSGLGVTSYQLHYYKQLTKPLTMAAMVFLACWFINLNTRGSSGAKMMIFALITGIGSYFILELIIRILAFSGLSVLLSTILPLLFIIMISNFVILHFQRA